MHYIKGPYTYYIVTTYKMDLFFKGYSRNTVRIAYLWSSNSKILFGASNVKPDNTKPSV